MTPPPLWGGVGIHLLNFGKTDKNYLSHAVVTAKIIVNLFTYKGKNVLFLGTGQICPALEAGQEKTKTWGVRRVIIFTATLTHFRKLLQNGN